MKAAREAQAELTAAWLKTFLWVEARRLGRTFQTPADYAGAGGRLFSATSRLRNLTLHARDLLQRGEALPAAGWMDYPRAALQRALVAALAGGSKAAGRYIGTTETGFGAAYARWWGRYN